MRPRALAIPLVLAASLAWAGGLAALHLRGSAGGLDAAEGVLADLRFRLRGVVRPPDLVRIVAIDDAAAALAGRYPLPRDRLAALVAALAAAGPRAIVLDMLLVDEGPAAADRALAEALGSAPSVIAMAATFPKTGGAPALLKPRPAFAARAAVGFVNVATDATGTPRFAPLLLSTGDGLAPSLPLRAAAFGLAASPRFLADAVEIGGHSLALDAGLRLPLAFYGPRGTIPTESAAAVLSGTHRPDAFADRVVVVGATVTGGGDVFPSPFDPLLPGVEVIATTIANLGEGAALARGPSVRLADAAIALLLTPAFLGLLAWRRSLAAYAAMAGLALAAAAANAFAFANGIWLAAALPMAAAAPPALLFGAVQLVLRRRQSEDLTRETETLRRFQSPKLSAWLEVDPGFLARPVRQEAALVFVDLSGFTGLSESLGADAARDLVKAFHELVDRAADASNGIVTAFMGDGAMILFGLPKAAPEDAANALRCCRRLAADTAAWLAKVGLDGRIGFKIGAQAGTIVASRLGGGSHQHITAIGDTVNVASRLMEVAAAGSAPIALGDDLLEAASRLRPAASAEELEGPFETRIRGRAEPLAAWRLRPAA